jgi:hypothetical protein
VGAPEEIEMDSVEVNIFENPHYSFDPPTAPTESASNEIGLSVIYLGACEMIILSPTTR